MSIRTPEEDASLVVSTRARASFKRPLSSGRQQSSSWDTHSPRSTKQARHATPCGPSQACNDGTRQQRAAHAHTRFLLCLRLRTLFTLIIGIGWHDSGLKVTPRVLYRTKGHSVGSCDSETLPPFMVGWESKASSVGGLVLSHPKARTQSLALRGVGGHVHHGDHML